LVGKSENTEHGHRSRQSIDKPLLRRGLHPRTDQRNQLANDEELKVAVLEGTEPVGQNGNRKSPRDLMIPHDCRHVVKGAQTQTEVCATSGSFEEFLEFGFGQGGYA
jgi:hypothetical protein